MKQDAARLQPSWFALWGLVFAVATCTAGGQVHSPSDPASVEEAAPAAQTAPAPSSTPEVPVADAPEAQQQGPLQPLKHALHALRKEQRTQPVRLMWLGDSHTAADFWSQEVRAGLALAYGDGGPGLVHVGLNVYRHSAALITQQGKWRTRPKAPSSWLPQGDGIFGLGGMATLPVTDGSRAQVELRPAVTQCSPAVEDCWQRAPRPVDGPISWQVVYRLSQVNSGFSAEVGASSVRIDRETVGADTARPADVRSFTLEGPSDVAWKLSRAHGEPEILGIYAETLKPGVVLDTLGINGARIGTAAAWNREHWVAEVRRRAPSLLILAYGTNEVGDSHPVTSYEAQYVEVLARYKEAAPDGACLLLGPTDRALPDWTTNPRVVEIDELVRKVALSQGCAFFSVFEAMGGEGSLREWAHQSPALANSDRVHLTPAGYRRLGQQILSFILSAP